MRLFGVYLIILVLGVATLFKILHLIIFKSALYSGDSKYCLDKTLPNWEKLPLASDKTCKCFITYDFTKPPRGSILDANGVVLAEDIDVFSLEWDAKTYKNTHFQYSKNKIDSLSKVFKKTGKSFSKEQLKKMLREQDSLKLVSLIHNASKDIATILYDKFPNKTATHYRNDLLKAVRLNGTVCFANSDDKDSKKWITDQDTLRLKNKIDLFKEEQLKSGFIVKVKTVRLKQPYIVIGSTNADGDFNKDGLERTFDALLEGQQGSSKKLTVNGVTIPYSKASKSKNIVPTISGSNIYSTIDTLIQRIAHDSLKLRLEAQNAEWGTVVIMEPQTGYVKAIVNLGRNAKGEYVENFNYAVRQLSETGSTFKLASLLVYLKNTPNPQTKTYPTGVHTFKTYTIKDDHTPPPKNESPIMVFQKSSNVGITSMILESCQNSQKKYLEELKKLGIETGKKIDLQIKGAQAPIIEKGKKNSYIDFLKSTHGVAIKLTPIHTLTYYNAVANGGRLMEPLFVNKIKLPQKDSIIEPKILMEQIASPEVIKQARNYLESVVYGANGTARKFQNPEFTFAGKTGTHDYYDTAKKSYRTDYNYVSFCGYFPADTPKYSCIVYISRVQPKSSLAVEVFAGIAKKIIETEKLATVKKSTGTAAVTKYSLGEIVSLRDFRAICETLGYSVSEELRGFFNKIFSNGSKEDSYVKTGITKKSDISATPVQVYNTSGIPKVTGMNARDAVYVLTQKGYKTIVKGRGYVYKQYPKGSKTIVLELRTLSDSNQEKN